MEESASRFGDGWHDQETYLFKIPVIKYCIDYSSGVENREIIALCFVPDLTTSSTIDLFMTA